MVKIIVVYKMIKTNIYIYIYIYNIVKLTNSKVLKKKLKIKGMQI